MHLCPSTLLRAGGGDTDIQYPLPPLMHCRRCHPLCSPLAFACAGKAPGGEGPAGSGEDFFNAPDDPHGFFDSLPDQPVQPDSATAGGAAGAAARGSSLTGIGSLSNGGAMSEPATPMGDGNHGEGAERVCVCTCCCACCFAVFHGLMVSCRWLVSTYEFEQQAYKALV